MTIRDSSALQAANVGLLGVVVLLATFDYRLSVPASLAFGAGWLALLLIVPRLRKFTFLQRWDGWLLPIAAQSKGVGLWTAAWFWLHGLFVWLAGKQLSWPAIALLAVSLVVFAKLAALSNRWSYAHIKLWKRINMLVWLLPPIVGAYALISGITPWIRTIIAAGMLVTTLFGFSGVKVKQPDHFAWLRVWLLLGGVLLGSLAILFAR